jgi:RNA polymerase sigma-70 factor (ECF subfamily)
MSRSAPVVEALPLPVTVKHVSGAIDPEESDLIVRSKQGDRAAFEALVVRHADRLGLVVGRLVDHREEAQEITQETFLRAWRGIGNFRGDSSFFTWIYRIAINETRRRGEKRGRWKQDLSLDEEAVTEAIDWSEAPESRFEQKDLRRALDEAIAALPLSHRIPLVLRDVQGLSTAEAADVMGIGESALKSRLHRARQAVRLSLEKHFAEAER